MWLRVPRSHTVDGVVERVSVRVLQVNPGVGNPRAGNPRAGNLSPDDQGQWRTRDPARNPRPAQLGVLTGHVDRLILLLGNCDWVSLRHDCSD